MSALGWFSFKRIYKLFSELCGLKEWAKRTELNEII